MSILDFQTKPFELFNSKWALLTAGTKDHFNMMTIGWGELGTLWSKSVTTVYVKKNRYTHQFIQDSDYFTVSFFPEQYKRDLGILGSISGRDGNKLAKTSLEPVFLENGITYKQADITILCKKIYEQDLDLAAMPENVVQMYYINEPVHTMYIGEVIEIQ